VRAYNWGGDPYNTVHVNAVKRGTYDFNFDYRDIAYFKFLPSFAANAATAAVAGLGTVVTQRDWPSFRVADACGVADGYPVRTTRWRPIPPSAPPKRS
jgi:hypothetical protein